MKMAPNNGGALKISRNIHFGLLTFFLKKKHKLYDFDTSISFSYSILK
jgi:hypothetical protein